jgi:MFS family permease
MIREHDPEAAMRTNNNEYHDSDQLDAFHPNNLFEPLGTLRSVQLQSTDASITTSNAHLPQWQIPAVIAVVCAGGLVTALDAAAVAAVLPSIAKDLSATTSELAWIGASYLLGSALLQPVWPTLSKLIGRKWTLAFGFILSILGSLIATLASQADVLIVGRAFQGLGAGNLNLMCIEVLFDLFSQDVHSRFKYFLIQAHFSCFGLALGPVLGGWLSSSITWRWCFHLDLLISGLAVAVLFILVDIPRSPQNADAPDLVAIEWLRPTLIIATTILLLLGLQLVGPCLSWDSATALGLMAVGCTVGVVCIVQRGPDRQSPLNSDGRSPAACLAVSFLHGFTYIGCLYYLPIYFQFVLGASPVRSGLWSLIPIFLMLLMRGIAATVSAWTDCDPPIVWTGATMLTLGIGVSIAFPPHRNLPLLVFVLLLVAIGTGLLFNAPFYALYHHSPRKDRS